MKKLEDLTFADDFMFRSQKLPPVIFASRVFDKQKLADLFTKY